MNEEQLEILNRFADGEVLDWSYLLNLDFQFKTKKQGYCLIRNGKNILLDYQDGEVLDCVSYENGDFKFRTKKHWLVQVVNGKII